MICNTDTTDKHTTRTTQRTAHFCLLTSSSQTDASSPNQSEFEWTANGFRIFIQHIRETYPDKLILQNRGMFFFNPLLPHYQVTTRGLVDFVLLESFRLNSNGGYDPNF